MSTYHTGTNTHVYSCKQASSTAFFWTPLAAFGRVGATSTVSWATAARKSAAAHSVC